MKRRDKRRDYTPQFKADAVRLCTTGGKTVAEVRQQFDLHERTLRRWIEQGAVDDGKGTEGALTTAERTELGELRKRVKRLEMERDILKKATAFFAKEST